MKNLLFILLWILSFPLFSQSNSTLSILVGRDLSSRVFYGNDLYGAKDGDKKKSNYRFGLNYERKLADNIWLKTGVRYAEVGFVDFQDTLRWGVQHNGNGTAAQNSVLSESKRTIDYSFLEIPAMLRFEFAKGKWQPFFEMGIANNFYIKTISKLLGPYEWTTETREKDVNKYQLSGVISVGVNFEVLKKCKLFLQPVYRHHITQVNDSSAEIHLRNVGVETGVRVLLN